MIQIIFVILINSLNNEFVYLIFNIYIILFLIFKIIIKEKMIEENIRILKEFSVSEIKSVVNTSIALQMSLVMFLLFFTNNISGALILLLCYITEYYVFGKVSEDIAISNKT